MNNFWDNLPKPFFALAPMEDVTDTVFRQVILKAGLLARDTQASRPDVFFTEFMNVNGFCHPEGRKSVAKRLEFTPAESPIIAQIWGKDPKLFYKTAQIIAKMGFAGIDINMGCPDKSVVKAGGGSALIKTPELATEIIQAVKAGVLGKSLLAGSEAFTRLRPSVSDEPRYDGREERASVAAGEDFPIMPISVKTRLGFSKVEEWKPWLTTLLQQNLDALTVHLRTRKEMSKVSAHHELIPDIVRLRDQIAPNTKLIINGDIADRTHGEKLAKKYPGIDGFMIGRGVFANPFCFERQPRKHTKEELIDLLKYHLDLFDSHFNTHQTHPTEYALAQYDPLKKFFKIYINNFPGANELRRQLMETKNTAEARDILNMLQ